MQQQTREENGHASSVLEPGASIERVVAEVHAPDDVADNRWIAAAAYVGPTLLVTLILGRNSPYARFHMNQGLIFVITWVLLWIAGLIGNALLAFIPVVGWIAAIAIDAALFLGWVALAFLGVRNALAGRAEPLPMIGKSMRIVR